MFSILDNYLQVEDLDKKKEYKIKFVVDGRIRRIIVSVYRILS